MLKRIALCGLMPAALFFIVPAGPVRAADLGPYPRQQFRPPQPAAYPQAFRWTGFYAGVQAGYGWGNTDAVTSISGFASEGFSYTTSGAIGGVHAGYNWQAGRLVLGLETDIEASGIGGSGVGTFSGLHSTSIDWAGSLRGRLGLAAGNTLFYLTGGLAYGSLSLDRSIGSGFAPFATGSGWTTGWTLGGGIEHAFSPNLSLRLEYRYTDFGQVTFTNPSLGLSDTSDVTQSAVRAGLSIRF